MGSPMLRQRAHVLGVIAAGLGLAAPAFASEGGGGSSLIEPQMGTIFEFGLGPYQTEIGLFARDTGTLHFRVFAPITFNPVSLSNTDQDDDKRIKYVFRAGGGAGGDFTVGLGGVFLVAARTQADYRWTYRGGAESLVGIMQADRVAYACWTDTQAVTVVNDGTWPESLLDPALTRMGVRAEKKRTCIVAATPMLRPPFWDPRP